MPLTDTSPESTSRTLPSSVRTSSSPVRLMPSATPVYSFYGARTRTSRPLFTSIPLYSSMRPDRSMVSRKIP